jgi:hypothetical protein
VRDAASRASAADAPAELIGLRSPIISVSEIPRNSLVFLDPLPGAENILTAFLCLKRCGAFAIWLGEAELDCVTINFVDTQVLLTEA